MTASKRRSPISSASCIRILSFLTLALAASQARAGAWPQPPDAWQLITQVSYYSTEKYRDSSGDARSQPRYSKLALNPYLEYGWTDKTTLGLNLMLPYVTSRTAGSEDHHAGLGDSEIFARHLLWQYEGWVISGHSLLKLPSLESDATTPRLGSSSTDIELGLGMGYNFSLLGGQHYADTQLAYRLRGSGPDNQWRAQASVGLQITPNLQILPQAFAVFSDTRLDNASLYTQSPEDDYDLVTAQLSAVYGLTPTSSAQLGTFRHVYARNSGLGGGVMLAFWKRF